MLKKDINFVKYVKKAVALCSAKKVKTSKSKKEELAKLKNDAINSKKTDGEL